MYKHINFDLPRTAYTTVRKDPATPFWNYHEHMNVPLNSADTYLEQYRNSSYYQNYMQQYFGMIKCIDDNVGKLLDYLTDEGLDENTVVV